MRIEPWEISKMLEARTRFERYTDTKVDHILTGPARIRDGLLALVGSALGLVVLGWVLRRNTKDA